MPTVKIYETETHDLSAVVYADGVYRNYVPDAMIAALEGDGFFEEARMGFPEAVLYEDDFQMSSPVGMESVLEEKLRGCVLVAEIGEEVRLYPHRLSADQLEFFALELGEDVLEDALARDTDGSGVLLKL